MDKRRRHSCIEDVASLTALIIYRRQMGTAHRRLRFFSDGDEGGEEGGRGVEDPSLLPDIVPMSRDRSVSLPNVQALRQQREREVGRELRRISDEFHFSYRGRLPSVQEEFNGEASSFPGARRSRSFRELWGALREMFAPTPSLHNLVDIENPPAPR